MCGPELLIAGSVIQGMGAFMGAQAQAQSAKMQSQALERRAEQQYTAGALRQGQAKRQAARVGGQQRAAFAEGGLGSGGSAFDVAMDTANEADMDLAMISYNARAQADQSRFESSIMQANARSARRSAPFAFLSPILSGAARFPDAFGVS